MGETTNFVLTEEQQLLQSTVAELAADLLPPEQVREVMDTPEAVAESAWESLTSSGLAGLLVPEEHGGSATSLVEAGLVCQELGRVIAPVPFLSSAVLATTALTAGASDVVAKTWLPRLATGEATATVAMPGRLHAEKTDQGWRLNGEAALVLDGLTADLVILTAEVDGHVMGFAVEATGLSCAPEEVLDQTRPMAIVGADNVEVTEEAVIAAEAIAEAIDRAAACLSMEQVGGMAAAHAMGVEYARTRYQFGRAIGSFQAVKHRLAEDLVLLESSRSLAMHAVAQASDLREGPVAVPMAKSYCSESYETIASDVLQVHGGIGFTWEHDIHLHLKRAKASKQLLGGPSKWRARLAAVEGW